MHVERFVKKKKKLKGKTCVHVNVTWHVRVMLTLSIQHYELLS